jgi:hypothetical protein
VSAVACTVVTGVRVRWCHAALHPVDDGGDAHTAADAEGDETGGEVAALELVDHRPEEHGTGRAEASLVERSGRQ